MSALGRHPKSLLLEKLSNPPEKLATESSEALLSKRSIVDSLCDLYLSRSSSIPKRNLGNCSQPIPPRPNTPTHPGDSCDNLYAAKTLNLVIPASLISPSRNNLRGERRHQIHLSTRSAKDISIIIYNDDRPSLEAVDVPELLRIIEKGKSDHSSTNCFGK